MKKIILLFALFYFSCTNAQTPALEWQTCFGGINNDQANSIQPTSDGGYIMAGYSVNPSGVHYYSKDAWVVKINNDGSLAWQKFLGGAQGDEANSIQLTSDGGYIMAGSTQSFDGDVSGLHLNGAGSSIDAWVVKLDSSGNVIWQKCLGGVGDERAKSILPTLDGGYIMAGSTDTYDDGDVSGFHSISGVNPSYRDAWVVKLDGTGNLEWQKCLGGTYDDAANNIQTTPDGGYVVAGQTFSNDGDVSENPTYTGKAWVMKLNSTGSLDWQKTLGGAYPGGSTANCIQLTADGGYIMAGATSSIDGDVSGNHGGTDAWVVKLSNVGSILWQKCLGGSGTDSGLSIQLTADGGYIIAGSSMFSFTGDVSGHHAGIGSDAWVVKIGSTGNLQTQRCLGGPNDDGANIIQLTTDGGYIIAGYTKSIDGDVSGNHYGGYSDGWVVKLSGIIIPPPPTANSQIFQIGATVTNLVAVGTALKWYANATVGSALANSAVLATGMYYVSQTVNGVESDRIAVAVTLTTTPIVSSPINYCKGASATPLTAIGATGSTLKWYTTASDGTALLTAPTPVTTVVGVTNYYVSQVNNGVESERATIIVNINAVPATPVAIMGTVSQGALVGTTTTATYSITAVADATSYLWTPPAGVNIVSGQGTTSVAVNFLGVTAGAGAIGNLSVKSVGSSGCYNAARNIALSKALPIAPTSLVLTDGVTSTAITSFVKYMGTGTVLKLSAAPVATATSYEWELPEGVIRTDASGTNSSTSYIYVDFSGVTTANTFSYLSTSGVLVYVLRIGVKAKNGVGVSITNDSSLTNPGTGSTAKLLTLTGLLPGAPTVTGQNVGVCGGRFYSYTIKGDSSTSSYLITAPPGSTVTSANNPGNLGNVLTTSDLSFRVTYPIGFTTTSSTIAPNRTITITSVNGIGNSLTNKVINLTTTMPAVVSISGGTTYSSCNQTFTTPLVLGAVTYTWTVPSGATIISGQNTNTVVVYYGALTGTQSIKLKTTNACGVSSVIKSLTLTEGSCPVLFKQDDAVISVINNIKLYPNPTNSILSFETTNDKTVDKVVVIDLLGKVILEEKPENNQINVERLAAGTYILQAFSVEEKFISKFVKE